MKCQCTTVLYNPSIFRRLHFTKQSTLIKPDHQIFLSKVTELFKLFKMCVFKLFRFISCKKQRFLFSIFVGHRVHTTNWDDCKLVLDEVILSAQAIWQSHKTKYKQPCNSRPCFLHYNTQCDSLNMCSFFTPWENGLSRCLWDTSLSASAFCKLLLACESWGWWNGSHSKHTEIIIPVATI